MLTHGLLPEEKLAKVRGQVGTAAGGGAEAVAASPAPEDAPPPRQPDGPARDALADRVAALEETVGDLRARLERLEADLGN